MSEATTPKNQIAEFHWEKLDCKNQPAGGLGAWRAKVPGGWLVAIRCGGGEGGGVTFYPDPYHQWDGGTMD
ncbi:hypothetical protein PN498_26075 [Oscillatoria sp. CS-180]|uniref:hypothetical protein n=1 Tax=Oscillatoria sp. CS-180 TaxID=3021720 RepID=UPI00232B5326|nr:hypothetical protein [Oscillatoria sp. CS-180]MDB9529485.1 hypothetical protein [Oscillatoria sp. CS-180]